MPDPQPRPLYIETGAGTVFAMLSEPVGERAETAVLICAPWGWDEVASYRSRREWAARLAAAGHPTLRFALPATGNSAGSPRDPGLVGAWVEAVGDAAAWLRTSGEAPRVAALGLGLGGLLARAAIARGAPIDDLVLWAAPASGRVFARATRAFSGLQEWDGAVEGAPPGSELPEGWLEAGGFVLSAGTLAELKQLAPDPAASPPRRVLLLERDGVAVDADLRQGFEAAGAEVAVAPGGGWAELVSHAEKTRMPQATAARVADWLAAGEEAAASATGTAAAVTPVAVPGDREELVLDVEGGAVRERPLSFAQGFGRAFGVLAEPAVGSDGGLCAVLLNAGAVRNVGPNRIWVETARRWAARGVPTLRLDLEGIGEADGTAPPDVRDFYLPKYEEQLRLVLDRLQELGEGERFLLVGLCAGGYWAFREGQADPRVCRLLLLNSGALAWDPALVDQREARKLTRASQRHWWGRLLRGEVGARKLLSALRSLLSGLAGLPRRLFGRGRRSLRGEIEAGLDRLEASGKGVVLAFSGGEPLARELESYGILAELERRQLVEAVALPGSDHTLRPVGAQAAARELLDAELERLLR